jgi:O-antigen/teichoic acid export membrane protein
LEGLLVIAVALLGGGYLACAVASVCAQIVAAYTLNTMLRRHVPWLRVGWTHANLRELERLWRPAIAALAIPLSLALNLQGMVLVVGSVLSPAAAATFTAVRTLSRVAIQLVVVFGRASMPELSAATALGQRNHVAAILRMNLAVLAIVLLPAAVVFGFYGTDIVSLWTRGGIVPEKSFVTLMAVGMVVHAVWMLAAQMLLAVNGHGRAAAAAFAVSIATTLAAVPSANVYGLEGVAAALLLGDAVLAALAARSVAQCVQIWRR